MDDRQEIVDELILREQVRKIIKIVRNRKAEQLKEEEGLRSVIRKLILAEGGAMNPIETSPRSRSTVKNYLEDLFQGTITQVLDDYDDLGEKEEREGFFAGFLAGLRNKFDEFDGITHTADTDAAVALAEDIDIDIEDDEGPAAPDVFIPGGEESDLAPDEEPEEEEDALSPPDEKTPEYKLGYNAAQETLPKVETQVLKGYEQFTKVGDTERAGVYKDWAIINYGLHMINKEKLITGEFPEMPADFAAELEKFREAGDVETTALGGEEGLGSPEPEKTEEIPELGELGGEEEAFEFEG